MTRAELRALVTHLRLPFQIALSTVFLWGVFVASGRFVSGTLLAWVAFTVGLSGGATAFNSVYDRDRGPVGGLRRPPPAPRALLPFSIAVQTAGLVVAAAVSPRVAAVYAAAAALFFAYSHPSTRTKRRPWLSIATVSAASGGLVFLGGALSAASNPAAPVWRVVAGAAASVATIAGFYPLTQLGQVAEDRDRRDRTFAVVHGRERSFVWAFALLGVAGAIDVLLVALVMGPAPAAGLALAQGTLGLQLMRWRRDPALDAGARSDHLVYATAAVHAVLVAARASTA